MLVVIAMEWWWYERVETLTKTDLQLALASDGDDVA